MSVLAAWLVGVALADLVRGGDRFRGRGIRTASAVIAAVVTVVVGLLAGLAHGSSLLLLLVGAGLAVAWVLLSNRALGTDTDTGSGVAVTVLGLGAAVPLLLSGLTRPAAGPLAAWLDWTTVPQLRDLSADLFLLLSGVFLAQLSTGNALVRLVLASIGAIRPHGLPQPSDRLRGGRLLGPLERVFILGLGLAGQVTAAGIVIAAKGLIRWPELRITARELGDEREDHVSIDAVTEYFQVGSFVSWLLAMGALWLAQAS
jgi:hypothetical protein